MSNDSLTLINSPRSVEISITSRCNLRCRYCYHFSQNNTHFPDLMKDEWISFFEELNQNAVLSVALTGGEPFLREDLPEIIQGIIDNRMRFCILSNGILINDRIAEFIASTKRCDYIQISLDGASSESHDACCGFGSFDAALKGIRILQKYDIPVQIRVTIHRYNVYQLEKIAQFILEELALPSFSTNSASYLGLCRKNESDVCLNTQERTYAMKTLLTLVHKFGKERISATAGPLAEAYRYQEMEKNRKMKNSDTSGGGFLSGCGCVWTQCAVRSDGMMIPCGMLPHLELGRINEKCIFDVWNTHPILDSMRKRHLISLDSFEYCQECAYKLSCTGNCPALAYSITGIIDAPSPDSCIRKFLNNGGIIPPSLHYEGQS